MKDMLKKLVSTQAHFGHQRRFRTPQLKKYLYTCYNGIDIINLDYTINQIDICLNFFQKNKEKNILIISSRELCPKGNWKQILKWKPGYISNFVFGKLEEFPEIIIVDKAAYNDNLINEAKKANIVIIGLCDTNTPNDILRKVDYPIVINDDSDSAIKLLLNTLIEHKNN